VRGRRAKRRGESAPELSNYISAGICDDLGEKGNSGVGTIREIQFSPKPEGGGSGEGECQERETQGWNLEERNQLKKGYVWTSSNGVRATTLERDDIHGGESWRDNEALIQQWWGLDKQAVRATQYLWGNRAQ